MIRPEVAGSPAEGARRFPTRFDRWYAVLSTALLLSPSSTATRSAGESHGLFRRWLVNGSGDDIVAIDFEPPQRARVAGFPVRLRRLMVSVDDPAALIAALR